MANVELQSLQPLRLSEMDNGSVEARFQEELEKIRDVMTEAGVSGSAKISITFDFKQHTSIGFLEMTSSVTSKLPAQKAGNILMMRDGKILEDVTSHSAEEPGLFDRRNGETTNTKTGEVTEE